MSGTLDVLQMKEEDFLKFLVAGIRLAGINLTSNGTIHPQSDSIYILNLKRTYEKPLLAARVMITIKIRLMSVSYHPEILDKLIETEDKIMVGRGSEGEKEIV